MISTFKTTLLVAATTVSTLSATAQLSINNPLQEAKGFNVFTEDSVIAVAGDTHGPVATGGNMVLRGNTVFTMNKSGTYPTNVNNDGNNYGMVIGGRIFYYSGNTSNVNQGYLRLGNTTGTTLWDTDNQTIPNAQNLQATSGAYNAQTRIQLQRMQSKTSALQSHGINFATAFNQFRFNSDLIASYPNNAACASNFNFITVPSGSNPHITLVQNKINYINVTSTQLNGWLAQGSIIFDNQPAADRVLIINVTITGGTTMSWNPANTGGIGDPESRYVLYNFANATSLELGPGNNSIWGTVYAPRATVNKTGANNTTGQIIAKSLRIAYGEIHYEPFVGTFPDCGGTTIINNYNNTRTGTPLPIKDIKLTATAGNNGNAVNWTVLQEQGVASYSLEKSTDAKNFTTLQTLIAKGDAAENNYAAQDNEATAKETYYRVKVNFTNGESTYSNIARISRSTDGGTSIYPNPFHNTLNVRTANAGALEVKVSDISGRVVRLLNVTAAAGEVVTVSLPESLENGMYFVQVYGESKAPLAAKTMMKN